MWWNSDRYDYCDGTISHDSACRSHHHIGSINSHDVSHPGGHYVTKCVLWCQVRNNDGVLGSLGQSRYPERRW